MYCGSKVCGCFSLYFTGPKAGTSKRLSRMNVYSGIFQGKQLNSPAFDRFLILLLTYLGLHRSVRQNDRQLDFTPAHLFFVGFSLYVVGRLVGWLFFSAFFLLSKVFSRV